MIGRSLGRLSALLARFERAVLATLILAIAILVLLNVVLRVFGITFAWADEIAVRAMIASGFVGASLMLRARIDPAVLLVHEVVPKAVANALGIAISAISAAFGCALLYFCLRWFDPVALVAAGFDIAAFEAARFNFIYTDTAPVTGLRAFWFYLVMPWFGLTVTLHALANLAEDLGLVARPEDPAGLGMDRRGT